VLQALVVNPAGNQVDIAAVLRRMDSNAAERHTAQRSNSQTHPSTDDAAHPRESPEADAIANASQTDSQRWRGSSEGAQDGSPVASGSYDAPARSIGYYRKDSGKYQGPVLDSNAQKLLHEEDEADVESLIYAMSEVRPSSWTRILCRRTDAANFSVATTLLPSSNCTCTNAVLQSMQTWVHKLARVQDDQLFLREINLMRCLSHPYIIRCLGCGVIDSEDGAYMSIVRARRLLCEAA
jgi:HD-GYP domain-containing protein (c-di-GMP phosphodiesterase class II)